MTRAIMAAAPDVLTPLALRVHGEYREMPGLRLSVRQAARLFGITPDVAVAVLDELRRLSVLVRSDDGTYALLRDL
jgi:hypothetical protein